VTGHGFDVAPLLGSGEHESVATALVGRVVTRGTRENEHDDREKVLSLERVEEFAATRGAKRRRGALVLGPFHFGPGRNFLVAFMRLSMRRASSRAALRRAGSTISTDT